MVRILYFAALKQVTNIAGESYDCAGEPVSVLLERVQERHGQLRPLLQHCRVAVNRHFVPLTHVLEVNDEIAIIPPVAGG